MIDNAEKHGQRLLSFRVRGRPELVIFEAENGGPGFDANAPSGSSLGLGLTLVRRIAEAHGGSAFALNRPEGGARVGFEVAVRPPAAV